MTATRPAPGISGGGERLSDDQLAHLVEEGRRAHGPRHSCPGCMLAREVQERRAAERWIPAKEPPHDERDALVWKALDGDGWQEIGSYREDGGWGVGGDAITHWRELPPAPAEGPEKEGAP